MSTTPAAHPAQYRELIGLEPVSLDPDALRTRPTPYEQLMRSILAHSGPVTPVEPRPGDAVEISDEAMAQGLATAGAASSAPAAPAGTPTTQAQQTGDDETPTDSSLSGDLSSDMYPDLGERVF